MDGLARVAGGGVPIDFDGEKLLLDAPTLRDYAHLEQYLLTQRPNVIVEATKANRELIRLAREEANAIPEADPNCAAKRKEIMTEAQQQADSIMNKAMAQAAKVNKISPQEVADYSDTPAGVGYLFWLKLSQRYPQKNFTLEKVTTVLEAMADEEFAQVLALRDQASGTDILGNSTGQLKKPREMATEEMTIAPSTGESSSGAQSETDSIQPASQT